MPDLFELYQSLTGVNPGLTLTVTSKSGPKINFSEIPQYGCQNSCFVINFMNIYLSSSKSINSKLSRIFFEVGRKIHYSSSSVAIWRPSPVIEVSKFIYSSSSFYWSKNYQFIPAISPENSRISRRQNKSPAETRATEISPISLLKLVKLVSKEVE